MRHPRCVQHWRHVLQLLEYAGTSAKDLTLTWAEGPANGSLVVTMTFFPRNHGHETLYEHFSKAMARGTPELSQGGDEKKD